MKTSVILRARNDMPLVEETVRMIKRQTLPVHLVAFDNHSTDGGRDVLKACADELVDVPEGAYVPGRVLNQGVCRATSDFVVFVNSDSTPVDERWLERILEPFANSNVAAVFSRQLPRPDCLPVQARDIEVTYGDGSAQARWRHCFSMASSALRRSVALEMPFDETLQYSEDVDWSWRVRGAGHEIRYAPQSAVYHSHNYSNEQWRKRQFGEGKAEARIFQWSPWQRSFLRYSLLPMARQVLSDASYCLKKHRWSGFLASPGFRYAQMIGRRSGFLAGLKELA